MTRDCQSLHVPRRNSTGLEPTLLFLVTIPVSLKPTLSKENTSSVVSKKAKPSEFTPKESLEWSGILTLGSLQKNDSKYVGACL